VLSKSTALLFSGWVIRGRQADYYRVLGTCDRAGNSTAFVEFLLAAVLTALREVSGTD